MCLEVVVGVYWADLESAATTLVQTEFIRKRGTLLNLCPNRRPVMYRESLVDNVGSQDFMTCQLSDLSCDDDGQDLCRCECSLTHSRPPISPVLSPAPVSHRARAEANTLTSPDKPLETEP